MEETTVIKSNTNCHKSCIDIYISGLLSAGLFLLIWGYKILNPFYTSWLLAGSDLTQHYIGYALYNNAPFSPMIGMMNNAVYPFSISVMFTDSIPIAAILAKIISHLTGCDIQYFGLWGLLCFVLMGVFSCILVRKYTSNHIISILASILFTLSPIMIYRVFWHTSLSSHFILILCLVLIAYRKEKLNTAAKCLLYWGIIGFLCAMIHLYFLPMCGMLLLCFVGFLICDKYFDHPRKNTINQSVQPPNVALNNTEENQNITLNCSKENQNISLNSSILSKIISSITGFLSTTLAATWWLGGFSSPVNSGSGGLGYYSYNLSSIFNPMGWSFLLKYYPLYADGQYEGFAYPGFGSLMLMMFAVILVIVILLFNVYFSLTNSIRLGKASDKANKTIQVDNNFDNSTADNGAKYKIFEHYKFNLQTLYLSTKSKFPYIITVAITIIILTIMAASNYVTFGTRLLFEIPLTDSIRHIWEIFRASGRLIWPAVYLCLFIALIIIIKFMPQRAVKIAILASVVLQLVDLSTMIRIKHNDFVKISDTYYSNTGSDYTFDNGINYSYNLDEKFFNEIVKNRQSKHIVLLDRDNFDFNQMYSFALFAAKNDLTINDYYFARGLNFSTYDVAKDFFNHPDDKTIYVISKKSMGELEEYDLNYYEFNDYYVGLKTPL